MRKAFGIIMLVFGTFSFLCFVWLPFKDTGVSGALWAPFLVSLHTCGGFYFLGIWMLVTKKKKKAPPKNAKAYASPPVASSKDSAAEKAPARETPSAPQAEWRQVVIDWARTQNAQKQPPEPAKSPELTPQQREEAARRDEEYRKQQEEERRKKREEAAKRREEQRQKHLEEEKKRQQEALRQWREKNPELAALLGRLESRAPFSVTFHGRPDAPGEDRLDGASDETGTIWLGVAPGRSLSEALDFYGELLEVRRELGSRDFVTEYVQIRWLLRLRANMQMLVLPSRDVMDREPEEVRARCRALSLHPVVNTGEGRFEDLLDNVVYRLEVVATYPGSADDAATYGVVRMYTDRPGS